MSGQDFPSSSEYPTLTTSPELRPAHQTTPLASWLHHQGMSSDQAITRLTQVLRQTLRPSHERIHAIHYLARLQHTQGTESDVIPVILEALLDREESVRSAAARALRQLHAPETLPALLNVLKHDADMSVRSEAAAALAERPHAIEQIPETLPTLLRALRDEIQYVRQNAAVALGKMGRSAKPAVPALLEALQDVDSITRRKATWALGEIGEKSENIEPFGEEVAQSLSKLLQDPDTITRVNAAWSLGHIGPDAQRALLPLIRSLDVPHTGLQQNSALALGRLGLLARPAIPKLLQCLEEVHENVRLNAAWALGQIGAEPAELLQETSGEAQTLPEDSREAVTLALLHRLKDPSDSVRMEATTALLHFQQEKQLTIPHLLETLAYHVNQFQGHMHEKAHLLATIAARDLALVAQVLFAKVSALLKPTNKDAQNYHPNEILEDIKVHIQTVLKLWNQVLPQTEAKPRHEAQQTLQRLEALHHLLLQETLRSWQQRFEQPLFEH